MTTPASKGRAVASGKPLPAPAPAAKQPLKPVKVKSRALKNSAHKPAAPAPPKDPEPPPKTPDPKNPDPAPEDKKFAKPEMMLPTTPSAVVNNLIARKMNDGGPPAEPISNTVKVLTRLSSAVSSGSDISDIKTDIVRIVSNQPEKADIFQSVLNCVDQERTSDMVEIRAIVEKELKRAVQSGGLTTTECLAVWDIANTIIEKNQAKSAKMNKPVDSSNIQKVDVSRIETEHLVQQKWEGTTPQGRQIIRMKLFELKRHVAVEVEQAKEEEEPAIDVK